MPRSATDKHRMHEDALAKLTAEWDVRGIDPATMKVDGRGTIRYGDSGVVLVAEGWEADPTRSLPPLLTRGAGDAQVEVELGEVLGEGGQGIVWLGRQAALRRDVAVKSVRPEVTTEELTRQLLREARITGALEHPNVVPIHAIGRDEAGRPLIVMARIDGRSWEDILCDEREAVATEDGPAPRLHQHLETLVAVARAAGFAHGRGVVHRDLKPENVMVGRHGEIYVVDWGIAVSVDGFVESAPPARDVDRVVGTPGYMAPEMASADGARIDERTDVYLLGAVLHELLTGHPPHDADTTLATLTHAYASPAPRYGPDVPPELGAIAARAMSREPDDRYPTAAAFAGAVSEFLAHRGSVLLCEQAGAKLEEVRELLARGSASAQDGRLLDRFNEARFGFVHALGIWQDNARARDGLQEGLEMMIEHELAHGSAGAAATLLGQLPDKRPRLAERVQRARDEERRAEAELARMKHAADPTVSDGPRAKAALVLAALWLPCHALVLYLDHAGLLRADRLAFGGLYSLLVLGTVAIGLLWRRRVLANASGLRVQITILLAFVSMAAIWPLAEALDITVPAAFVLCAFVGAVVFMLGAVNVDRRFTAWAASLAPALGLMLLWPDYSPWIMALAGTVGSGVLGWLRLRTKSLDQIRPLSQRWSQRKPGAP